MAQMSHGEGREMQTSKAAGQQELELGRQQGQTYQDALRHMVREIAEDGQETQAGDYIVSYAVEKAEGMYKPDGNGLRWREPDRDNLHVEVSVRDAADGRFVPCLDVHATLVDTDGNEVGTHRQPFVWHPWLYHYGRNWRVPGDGTYTLRVKIDPPDFARHDEKNGDRYTRPVTVEFPNVKVKTGQS